MHYLSEVWWSLGLWSNLLFSVFFFGSLILYVGLAYYVIISFKKSRLAKTLLGVALALFIVPFSLFTLIMGVFLFEHANPGASRFFQIHAAVVNTCLIDPERLHCPHQLEDIRVVEEKEFDKVKRCCQMSYVYRPEDNSYRLIIRYSPVRVVVFDPSFMAYNDHNFVEADVGVIGQDKTTFYDPREGKEVTLIFDEWDYTEK
jgi:hypothetical protein